MRYADTMGLSLGYAFLILLYILIITISYRVFWGRRYDGHPLMRKLLVYGLLAKLVFGILLSLIYEFRYNWEGDTGYYFRSSIALSGLLWQDPWSYIRMVLGSLDPQVHMVARAVGYYAPLTDLPRFAVHRFYSLFAIFSFKNYYLFTLVSNGFLFAFNWSVFAFFVELYPKRIKLLAAAFLFIPSVLFWGSGIMKDPVTYTFSGVFVMSFYRLFFQRKISVRHILLLLLSAYLIIEMKPYIFYVFLLGCIVWLGFTWVRTIKSSFVKLVAFPVIVIGLTAGGYALLSRVASSVGGAYGSVESMITKAQVSQDDLKQEYYHGTSFDIGDYEASMAGAASVAPQAIIAGLYRPFVFEAGSVAVFFSGAENLFFLLASLYVLFIVGLRKAFVVVKNNPFIVFCLFVAIVFSLGLGLSTSNFGALVRFKIPMLPFWFLGLMLTIVEYRELKEREDEERLKENPFVS